MREWFASDVLQPLQIAIENAHSEVVNTAAQLGYQGIRLTPLSELGTERVVAADDSLVLAQIHARIQEYLRNPANRGSVQLIQAEQVRKNK